MSEPSKEEEEVAETENTENPDQEVNMILCNNLYRKYLYAIKFELELDSKTLHLISCSLMKMVIWPIQVSAQPHPDANVYSAKSCAA